MKTKYIFLDINHSITVIHTIRFEFHEDPFSLLFTKVSPELVQGSAPGIISINIGIHDPLVLNILVLSIAG